jgi:hypothetical protein
LRVNLRLISLLAHLRRLKACNVVASTWRELPKSCCEDKRRTREYCPLPRRPSCCATRCCDRLRCREMLKGLPCHRRPPMFRAGRQVTHCSRSLVKRFRASINAPPCPSLPSACGAVPFTLAPLWGLAPCLPCLSTSLVTGYLRCSAYQRISAIDAASTRGRILARLLMLVFPGRTKPVMSSAFRASSASRESAFPLFALGVM